LTIHTFDLQWYQQQLSIGKRRKMYICICKGITEKMLVDQLAITNRNEKEILKNLGIGDSCGVCVIDCLKKIQEIHPLSDSQSHNSDS
jgi:bacterioferritin-associated ferredoxin